LKNILEGKIIGKPATGSKRLSIPCVLAKKKSTFSFCLSKEWEKLKTAGVIYLLLSRLLKEEEERVWWC